MKRIILLLLISSNIALAQTSRLYNDNGKLLVDSSYRIDRFSFSNIQTIEKILLPKMYNEIRYSAVAMENEFEGTVIVQLSISAKAQNYNVKIIKSDSEDLNKVVLSFFNSLGDYAKAQIAPNKGTITVYLPVKFELFKDEYNKLLNKNHTVTIQGHPSAPVIHIVQ